MKIIGALAGFLILFPFAAISQTISGTIKDDTDKPLAGASVALKKVTDSTVVKLAVSSAAGNYQFLNIPNGKYFINTTFVGYSSSNSKSFEHSGSVTTVPALILVKSNNDLKEVTVTATRPIVEVKADKTI